MTSEFLMTGHGHWVNDWCDRRNPFSRGPVFAHSTLISRGRPNHDWKKPNSEWRTANAPFLTNNSTSESSAAPDPQVPCLTSVLNSLKTLKSILSYSILWAMVGANNEVFLWGTYARMLIEYVWDSASYLVAYKIPPFSKQAPTTTTTTTNLYDANCQHQ